MWPGFDSRTRRHMWVEFVVGSRPRSEGFSPGSPVFLPPQKSTLLNSNSIGNSGRRATLWKYHCKFPFFILFNDIDISHKLKRKGKTFIIVKFSGHKIKTKLYKERTKLKNINIASVFPSFSNATSAGQARIFINENISDGISA